jgi:hypothetical protein
MLSNRTVSARSPMIRMAVRTAAEHGNYENDKEWLYRLHTRLLSEMASINDGGRHRFRFTLYGTFVNTSVPKGASPLVCAFPSRGRLKMFSTVFSME